MLSQTVEYALRAVVYLAGHSPQACTTEAMAATTRVPRAYLSKVLQSLARAGVVHSQRGLGGGMTLARLPAEITILEVVNAVEPIQRIRTCPLGLAAHGVHLCPLHRRVDNALAMVEQAFAGSDIGRSAGRADHERAVVFLSQHQAEKEGRRQGMKYEPLLHVVLYQPEIPPNTGNIGRTCVAVGAKLWLVKPLGFQIDEKQLRRAGLDYWPHLDWEAVENWTELTEKLAEPFGRRRLWLFTKTARRLYTSAAYAKGDILLFGSESAGLPPELLAQYAEQTVRLPMRKEVRSLNLSATAAAAMYEAVRQIGVVPGINVPGN